MRKIVNGIRYDTERARPIGTASCCCWRARLYCTRRSGRYFLAGMGNPMSRFAQSNGRNVYKGGQDIIPLSHEEASSWARHYLMPHEFQLEFPDPDE